MTTPFPRRHSNYGASLLDFAQEAATETFMASPWARLVSLATRVELGGGEWLFRAGESGDSVYVVLWGRLEVVAERPEPAVISIRGRGDAVGELALLTGAPHVHSVRARRDSSLLRISRADFDRVLTEDREYAVALTRRMAERLREVTARALPIDPIPSTIAVVPICGGTAAADFARALARSLARLASVAVLTEVPGEDIQAGILDRAERDHDHVLLIASEPLGDSAWTGFAVRSADRVLGVVDRARVPEQADPKLGMLKGCDLVVLKARAGAWVDELGPRAVHNLPDGPTPAGIGRLARRLAGRSVGLVLSGGGARAFSHLGVLDELEAAGVTIDRVGGCSMGCFIAAVYAQGRSADEVAEVVREEFVRRHLLRDYTLPIAALLRHRRAFAMAQRVFGDTRIEELPLDYFCVSCDLLTAELVVHRRGLVWLASGASMNLPAIYPPLPLEGRLLVDGGVLNNLPTDVMAAVGEGPVIASDATTNSDLQSGRRRAGGPARLDRAMLRAREIIVGTLGPVPSFKETLIRSIVLGSADTAMNAQEHAALVIAPDIRGIALTDWGRIDEMREAGRAAARAALETAPELAGGP
jgi:predicted acylesterase/phospholipase RssA/CRP-like cAMP-binding protein